MDGNAFTLAADGTLLCLTLPPESVWAMNLMEKFGGRVPTGALANPPWWRATA